MRTVLLVTASLLVTAPAFAQSTEELRAELDAQKEIQKILRQKIARLENELAKQDAAPNYAIDRHDNSITEDDPVEDAALERALQRRGDAVLKPYVVEVAPSLSWSFKESNANGGREEVSGAGLDARMGLPKGWMIGASVPAVRRSIDSVGQNSGFGDVTFSVWKTLIPAKKQSASLVGSLTYSMPTNGGNDTDPVPLGSGHHSLTAQLSTVKTLDPIALYGRISVTHSFEREVNQISIDRAPRIGVSAGANLAVTPDVTVGAGVSLFREENMEIDGVEVSESSTTQGQVGLGVGLILSRDVFLNLSTAFGVTDDAPDFSVRASVPFRF
jgi:hypothetical protein